ncbi:2-acylglycerol O-acyltransferase 1-like isoform X2 [Chironomus tepperi]|uniref:2-acylglycerol O-acyltransferase 1-like isoform X2 n=1 Tax=Chironomus tepperi TaxID=113505 RepID=UPI00391F9288
MSEWAPIVNVSMKRRYEVFSAFCFIMMVLFAELLSVYAIYLLLFRTGIIGKTLFAGYMIFMLSDLKADETGIRGQGSDWVRSWSWWKHFADYFPVELVKTVDLPPTKNYLFACFPHGVISCGLFTNFATNATGFHEKFPGIRSKLCTLSFHFYVPFFRELALSWGLMSPKYTAIKRALSQSTNKLALCNQDGYTSNVVSIVVGGAQEALYSRPGVYQIHIQNRKGFIKAAIETGASLVPVFSFGEVDVYDSPKIEPGSMLRKFQEKYKAWTGVAPAIFIGRGFFQYSFGLIPRRNPIHTVVGSPISVEKNESPTNEQIAALHTQFVHEIENLFETHKHKYIKNSDNVKLIMV